MISLTWMRRLDRWVGVPLLFILSGWLGLYRLVKINRTGKTSRRVLVLLLSEMGSLVLAEPALRRLRQRQQQLGGDIALCMMRRNAPCQELLSSLRGAEQFVLSDHSLWALIADLWRLRHWCRTQGFDAVVDLELFTRFSALLALFSGARMRVGFDNGNAEGLYRGRAFNQPVSYNPHRHMAWNYLALAERVSGPAGSTHQDEALLPCVAPFQFEVACQRGWDRQLAERLGVRVDQIPQQQLLLINVSASALIEQRNWPEELQQRCIHQLLDIMPGARVLLCGGADEVGVAARIEQQVGDCRCRSVAGLFPLAQLPYLYARAAVMITPDSGPAHFAAVSAMPVVVLFGPETPALFRPLGKSRVLYSQLHCSPCVSAANQRRTDCLDNRCMQQLSPEQVVDAVVELLGSTVVRLRPRDSA